MDRDPSHRPPLTILGLSRSGAAVARYAQPRGYDCFLSETLPASPRNDALRQELRALGVAIEMGGHGQRCYTHADTVVVSPGIPPASPILQELAACGKTLISEVELAWRESQRLAEPPAWVGITGTNGKTTTTTLLSAIFSEAGYRSPACGNIGVPILDCLGDTPTPQVIVAELSSYQLHFSPTLHVGVGIYLNLTPDHLDWHGSLPAYERAKAGLFLGERAPQWAVLRADDAACRRLAEQTPSRQMGFALSEAALPSDWPGRAYRDAAGMLWLAQAGQAPEPLLNVAELTLRGDHNHENVLAAAAAAWAWGVPLEAIRTACRQFRGVPHRLEPVGTVEGVTFWNDSKATNPEASISALRAFAGQRVVLIAGGRDKHGPLDDFIAEARPVVEALVLIGEAADRFEQAFRTGGMAALHRAASLDEAVALADGLARRGGGTVLFSPACASFDMFSDFEARGRAFTQAVATLRPAAPLSR